MPPSNLRPEQVRRTIALVVDDLGLSFESTVYTRTALRKFVEQQMQPGDLVAIVRTSAGAGALQQFTSDKRQLLAAVERIRWNASFNNNVSAFAPLEGDPTSSMQSRRNNQSGQNNDNANANDELNKFREDVFAVGTLGALNYVVRGMHELPGRKSVVLLSEGFQLYRRNDNGGQDSNDRVLTALRRLTSDSRPPTIRRASPPINSKNSFQIVATVCLRRNRGCAIWRSRRAASLSSTRTIWRAASGASWMIRRATT